ncbi:copper homeostasis protein CutC [Gracilibacillus oryzae]|uniref:PF03932 family protein CutC n=1 Tax=Gracilibacillus oryzae TaxID=1672701 RepID=A0A7C8KYZ0_9BACI|nr:copper homeostasis protein CutC [Gracilibacillus oryzae]KAB8134186.1 copper homeostasis protein CutC [Gracilibacillus oryzae]
MILEVIVQNAEEARRAEELGADRLELVAAISEGGLTPSHGTIKNVLESVTIPVQIMIRPHGYHFHYTKTDRTAILADIENVITLGGTGIVFGALKEDHTVDEECLTQITYLFPEIDITFHRAFDEVTSQSEAYLTLAKYKQNIRRILTSGGEKDCLTGVNKLCELVELSHKMNGPHIMPGGGLTLDNIGSIHEKVKASQYHVGSSVRKEQSFEQDFDEHSITTLVHSLKNE